MLKKRSVPDVAWVFILALVVRLLVLMRFGDSAYYLPSSGDMKFYADWAQRIVGGAWTDHQAFYGLPGYPFFLAGIFALVGFDPFAVGVLQTISEAAIAVLLFQMAAWAFPGPRARWVGGLAAAGWIFFQPAQAFSVILMPTTWAVLAFWGVFYWSVQTESRSLWRPWLGMGLLVGVAATWVATVLFILPLSLAAAGRNLRKPAAILAATACLAAGAFLGTAPCWLHNRFVAGEPVWLSAHSGLNFWVGNHPGATGFPSLPPELQRASQEGMLKDSLRVARQEAGRPLRNGEVSQFWSAKAAAYIHEHPGQWLGLLGLKIRNFWNAVQYDDLSVITPLAERRIATPGLRFGWVAIAALAGLAVLWRRSPRSRWIAAAVGLHMLALLPVFVTERYRLAAVPGLLLLAGGGLAALAEALALQEMARVRLWAGAAVAACVGVFLPVHEPTLRWLDTYNSGLKALETGDMEQARRKLETALQIEPNHPEIQTSMGNYWLRVNNAPKAREAYARALELNPETMVALNNLGLIEMTQGDYASAKTRFAAALKIEPQDASLKELLEICTQRAAAAAK